jgi:hypothetical protein
LEPPVVVAVIVVGVVQVVGDQVVDMVAVRHRLVTAVWTMLVAFWMTSAIMVRRAAIGIGRTHGDDVFVEVVLVRMMKMAVVEIVDVAIVRYRRVTAAWTVLVRMIAMNFMIAHGYPFLAKPTQCFSPACATAFSTNVRT